MLTVGPDCFSRDERRGEGVAHGKRCMFGRSRSHLLRAALTTAESSAALAPGDSRRRIHVGGIDESSIQSRSNPGEYRIRGASAVDWRGSIGDRSAIDRAQQSLRSCGVPTARFAIGRASNSELRASSF
ncbi:MAG: hypothetical protein R6X02_06650 [Enhygromyxa sp.]